MVEQRVVFGCGLRPRSAASVTLVCLLLLLSLPPVLPARAQLEAGVRAQVPPAIVQIGVTVRVTGNDSVAEQLVVRGSGAIVSPDGLILTNDHVIDLTDLRAQLAAEQAQLERQGRARRLEVVADHFVILAGEPDELAAPRFQAVLVETDPKLDLALLRIDRDAAGASLQADLLNLPYLQLGDSDTVELGEPVHVFGYPAIGSGLLTYTQGTVSSFDLAEGITGRAWITTDATVSGGSSGGGAVNGRGQLIGIPTQAGAIECRPGDTNGDGVADELDVGCLPIGGSLNQLRPVNLAEPLLAEVCAVCDPVSRRPPALATLTIAEGGLAVPYGVDTVEHRPALVTTPDGGVVAIFTAEVESATWAGARKLWVTRFDPVRGRWLPAQPLPGGPIQIDPTAVVDSEGVIHLVYAERAGDGPDDLATLMYTRSFGLGLWEQPVPVSPHPDAGNQLRPALAVDIDDRLYLVWQESRTIPAADRLIFPERAAVVFSQQRAGVWTLPRELKPFVGYEWLTLVVAGDRLIAMWSLADRGIEYLGWASRLLDAGAEWAASEGMVPDQDNAPMMLAGGRDLLGDAGHGEAVLAAAPRGHLATPVELRYLGANASDWSDMTTLVTHPKPEDGDQIENLSVVRGPDGTLYTLFEFGPVAEREVTVITQADGVALPGPETVITGAQPGPQRHAAAAVAVDGALWVLGTDLAVDEGASPLWVRRWLPAADPQPASVVDLLPAVDDVPLPLGLADGAWDPVSLAGETPRPSTDPAATSERLTLDWLMRDAALIPFDTSRPQPVVREVSIDRFDSAEGAVAALDFLLNERVAAGGTEVLVALACLSGEGIQRYVEGPSHLPQQPDGEELSLYYQWENLLIRLTEVYPPGTFASIGGDSAELGFATLPCPSLPIAVRPRLRQAAVARLPLTEALPTEREVRMTAGPAGARGRGDLLAAAPNLPLDEWGWREHVVQTYTDPQSGLTYLEAEIIQLGGPEYAAAALAHLADERRQVGALTDVAPPPTLTGDGTVRVLTGPALIPGWQGSQEATILVQDHELLFRVTAVSPFAPPVDHAAAVVATMVARRPPAAQPDVPPAAAQR